jgi:hypothetical protein
MALTTRFQQVDPMSMDYPEYEELRQKSRFLGLLWRIGDMGYYLGLIGGIIWPGAVLSQQFSKQTTHLPWDKAVLLTVIGMTFGFSLLLGAESLKGFAIRRGKRLNRKS